MLDTYFHLLQELDIDYAYLLQERYSEATEENSISTEIHHHQNQIENKHIDEIPTESYPRLQNDTHLLDSSFIVECQDTSFDFFQLNQSIKSNLIFSLNQSLPLLVIVEQLDHTFYSDYNALQNIIYQLFYLFGNRQLTDISIYYLALNSTQLNRTLSEELKTIIQHAEIRFIIGHSLDFVKEFTDQLSNKITFENTNLINSLLELSKQFLKTQPVKLMNMNDFKLKEFNITEKQTYWENTLTPAIQQCSQCDLRKTCKQPVVGMGSNQADIVFVGEAPGEDEDIQALPFVGQSGKLLDSMMKSIGLDRQTNIYITNVVKCRPQQNRTPTNTEVKTCEAYLKQQLILIQPKLIVAVGKTSGTYLLGREVIYKTDRHKIHSYEGMPFVVTYHPSYLLRSPSEKIKSWEDFSFIKATINNII